MKRVRGTKLVLVKPCPKVRAPERLVLTDGFSSCEVLDEAQALLERVLRLLKDPVWEEHTTVAAPFALARSYALTILDRLSKMAELR